MENIDESKRDKIKEDFSKNFKAPLVLAAREQEIKNDILSYIDQLSLDEVDAISQLEKLRKGEISSSDLDMSKINQIGNKVTVGMASIVNKYKTL
jgi:hypothetical protein